MPGEPDGPAWEAELKRGGLKADNGKSDTASTVVPMYCVLDGSLPLKMIFNVPSPREPCSPAGRGEGAGAGGGVIFREVDAPRGPERRFWVQSTPQGEA